MDVVVRVMMLSFMYEGSRTRHDVYFSYMSLCIAMLEPFIIRLDFLFADFFRLVAGFSSHFWIFLISVALYWENK